MRAWFRPLGLLSACLVLLGPSLRAAERDTRIADAAKGRDAGAVRALLLRKADVNTPQADGATALHWAAYADDAALARELISAGARVDAVNDYGVTPLQLAAINGSAAMIDTLVAAGANANAALPTGETILMTAAHTGKVAAVKALLSRGANVNATEGVMGQTALMWAIWQGHLDVVKTLIEAGANVHAASNSGFTPLLFAVREGNLEATRLLLSSGATVNEAAKDGNTALHVAVVRGYLPLAKFLLDHGANPNADGPGFTPLHWAAGTFESIHSHDYIYNETAVNTVHEWSVLAGITSQETKHDLIRALLARGADINARIKRPPPRYGFTLFKANLQTGGTPFYLAALVSDLPTMHLLLVNGADPSIAATDGTTPLIVAAGLARVPNETRVPESSVIDAVTLLLDLGNDIKASNRAGLTPLHGATMAGLDTVVEFLVKRGADINAKNKAGETPLKMANGFIDAALLNVRPSTAAVLKRLGGVE